MSIIQRIQIIFGLAQRVSTTIDAVEPTQKQVADSEIDLIGKRLTGVVDRRFRRLDRQVRWEMINKLSHDSSRPVH